MVRGRRREDFHLAAPTQLSESRRHYPLLGLLGTAARNTVMGRRHISRDVAERVPAADRALHHASMPEAVDGGSNSSGSCRITRSSATTRLVPGSRGTAAHSLAVRPNSTSSPSAYWTRRDWTGPPALVRDSCDLTDLRQPTVIVEQLVNVRDHDHKVDIRLRRGCPASPGPNQSDS
jgi:hypothetical protein